MMSRILKFKSIGFTIFIACHSFIQAQSISFNSSGLVGTNITNPTSLDFGPNNKLYVAQQDGIIWEYDIERDTAAPGEGTYTILSSNQITLIKNNTPNHNDDGTNNSTQARQITGILTAGTASNPILYVTSSDSRIGGGGSAGNDVNLDTNSGVLSRLTWNGSAWEKVDLVRGLPRCEENHSTNGLDVFVDGGTTYLLIQVGGNTNQGAPSNNFAGSSEYYLSGAILIVNLTQLEQMEATNGGPYLDPRTGNTPYIYDLPSLNDPERQDIDNTHASFPYDASHPMYNATIDLGDPFGGNNGLNQTFPEAGGPVQIFAPGFRNAYDVVITENGRVFTSDNGPNGGWGGAPLIYDSSDNLKGTHNTTSYDPGAGDYVTNEFNIENGASLGDALHYVGTTSDANNTYYGGHPVPIRAFPDKARVYKYEYNGSNWVENGAYDWSTLISGVRGYFNASGFTMFDFPNDSRQGNYDRSLSSSDVNILDIVSSSTNGICEYTATNFGGAMQGDILTASFNGNINRYEFDTDGVTLLSQNNGFLNGFGSIPLDLIALDDSHDYAGTIWVVTYGANDITIFEPADFGDCFLPGDPEYVGNEDYDNDGFTNDDEISNGTNHCSGGSQPNDYDGDFISDLLDPDDDNDGILDVVDAFAIDPQNGLGTNLPIHYPFWNNDPGTGFFGLGFTGLQLDPSGSTDYLNQFDSNSLSFGGAGGKATVDAVSSGDALNSTNTQENAFQFGINVDSNSNPFTVYSKIETPFNGSNPLDTQSYGIFIGNGDQDNYLKVALMDGITNGDATYGFEIVLEDNGISSTSTYDVANLLLATGVDLYISVNPSLNSAQIYYSLDNGINVIALGSPMSLPTSFLDPNDTIGLAVGIIGTSGSSGSSYTATWDYIDITEDSGLQLEAMANSVDFGQSSTTSSINELNLDVKNIGNPATGPIEVTQLNFTGTNANLFSSNLSLPISIGPQSEVLIPIAFDPDTTIGTKSATLEIIHDGTNGPIQVSLVAEVANETPLVRISAGSPSVVSSTDSGPDWESNPDEGAYNGTSYAVNTGRIASTSFVYANRHSSIPSYIDETTFNGLFNYERWDDGPDPEMEFTIPISNGNYTVNLYVGNNYEGTDQVGERVYDILLEGNLVENDLDLVATYGHQVAAMRSYPVTVNDNELNIRFEHNVENPLINAIEIIGFAANVNLPPNAVISANPTSGAAPLDVVFSGSNSTDDNNNIVSYEWDFGNGDTATGINPNYTFTQDGTYTVTLTVTDDANATDTDTIDITVQTPGSCQWNALADSDLGKIEAQSAKIGDKLYVFAGFVESLVITGATEIYDTNTDSWSYGTPMPIPVTHMGIAAVGTDVWIIAGFAGSHPGVATDAVQIYDTLTDTWSTGPSIPAPRGSGAAAYNDGKIHVFGGLLPDRVTDVDEHYVLDVNNQGLGWVLAAALPNARNHLSAASFNGLIYAIGGQTGHDNESEVLDTNLLEVYDPDTDTWSTLQNLPTARSHFEPGTAVHNGKIIIAGGRTGSSFFYDDVTQYDIATNTWSELCELPENLLAPAAKVFGHRLIVANGGVDGIGGPSKTTRWLTVEDEFPQLVLDPISNQSNQVGDLSTLVISASGGDPNANVTYSMSNQPSGLSVEPTNGQIIGTVDASALTGGTNNDGIHLVSVTITKPGSEDITQDFTWTITAQNNLWNDKNEDENYTARHECSFVQAGDKFYLFGGRESAQTLDVYDYSTDSWNSLPNSAPHEFNHFQAVEFEGLIWVIGAFRTNDFPNEVPADYIWMFNPVSQEWIQGPEIPASRKRGSAGLVVYNNKFYIVGGNTDGHDGGYVNWFDEYDPSTGIWTVLTDAPRSRDHFHAAVIDGKLYAASGRLSGGMGGVFAPLIAEVDVYDFATESWSTLSNSRNLPTPRAGAIVANFKNKLIVAGGEPATGSDAFDVTEIYDPVVESWSTGDNLVHKRHGTQGIVSGNGLYVTGGSPNQGGGNQLNMEFYGQDDPAGTASAASSLSANSDETFAIGETKTISLNSNGGTVGDILKSYALSGTDASDFTINSGDVPFKLLGAGDTHDISVSYNGGVYNKNAVLTITYNNTDTEIINLGVPRNELIYQNSNWTPYAPDETTAEENVRIMNGTYTLASDIETYHLNIDSGATFTANPGASLTTHGDVSSDGSLEFDSNSSSYSSFIPNGGISGNIVYKRHVNNTAAVGESDANDLIAPPLSGQAFNDFITNNSNIVSNGANTLYLFGPFNKTTGAYDIYANTETSSLDAGTGYRAASTNADTFTFSGLVNAGTIQVPIINSGPSFQEWNLIGNPYPSYISLEDFLSVNISQFGASNAAVYGYDGNASNGWVVWNQAFSTMNPNTLIAPGQGFFVTSEVAGGTVTFNPSMRRKGQSDDFIAGRTTPDNSYFLELKLSQNTENYHTNFYFTPEASLGLDKGYDAEVWSGNAPAFGVFSYLVEDNTGLPMHIQSLGDNDFNAIEIPLGLNANSGEQIQISILENTLPDTVEVYLEDRQEQTFTLLNTTDYVATLNSAVNPIGRFYLSFTNTTLSSSNSILDQLHVFNNPSTQTVVISGLINEPAEAKIYDIQGRRVLSKALKMNSSRQEIAVNGLQSGAYVISIETIGEKMTKKLIIN
ncbi:MAG: kelch repeat-containing protein [Bacteroidota bacterium]